MKQKWRRILIFFLVVDLCAIGILSGYHFFQEKEKKEKDTITVSGKKNISTMKIMPSGEPIGVYVETRGLLVLNTVEVKGKDGMIYEPGGNVVKTGDYITEWNEKKVTTILELQDAIAKNGTQKGKVTVVRNGEKMKVAIKPVLGEDGAYKIGIWVREDTQGIGTLTYITKEGEFGTLGHGITDVDTGDLLDLKGGEMYKTQILGITKGNTGEPGELHGYINMVATNEIGIIEKNTEFGVFGTLRKRYNKKSEIGYLPVGLKEEIEEGKAWIYTNLDGAAKKYEIEILETYPDSTTNKCMMIEIVDNRLVELTGGIVQGMSGSPIIQNGKIIGAVTHVMVDDPTMGYGIFIEMMLEHN